MGRSTVAIVTIMVMTCAGPVSSGERSGTEADEASADVFFPAIWGEGLGTLPRHSSETRSARVDAMGKDFGKRILASDWQAAFKRQFDIDIAMPTLAVIMFVLQIDPLWTTGTFDADGARLYLERISLLPEDVARRWQRELDAVAKPGSGVDLTRAVAFLIQSDPMFPGGKFNAEQSDRLLTRLASLDRATIRNWADAAGLYSSQAALSLIHDDSFFDASGTFNKESHLGALQKLQAAVRDRERAPADDRQPDGHPSPGPPLGPPESSPPDPEAPAPGKGAPEDATGPEPAPVPRDEPLVAQPRGQRSESAKRARPTAAQQQAEGLRARLRTADGHRAAGRHIEAYAAYKSVSAKAKDTPSGRQAARRVAAYEADAAFMKKYKAAARNGPADSLLSLAKSYTTNGKTDLAKRTYERILDEHPDSAAAKAARDALAAHK